MKQKKHFLFNILTTLTLCLALTLSMIITSPLTAHAEEDTEEETKTYSLQFSVARDKYADGNLVATSSELQVLTSYSEIQIFSFTYGDTNYHQAIVIPRFYDFNAYPLSYTTTVCASDGTITEKTGSTTVSKAKTSTGEYVPIYLTCFGSPIDQYGNFNSWEEDGVYYNVKATLTEPFNLHFDTYQDAIDYLCTYYENGATDTINPEESNLPTWSDLNNTTTYDNGSIALTNFNADNTVNVSWSGLSGIGDDTSENSFVTVEFGFSNSSSAGNAVATYQYDDFIAVNDGGFNIPISDILALSEGNYLLYIKCTPYHYNMDDMTARLYKGSASYVYYDENQNLSWYDQIKNSISDNGLQRGTVYLTDFYLSGISVGDFDVLGRRHISWTGTTKDTQVLLVPDDDTQVIITYIVRNNDEDLTTTPMLHKTVTIGEGSVWVNYKEILQESEDNNFAWDGEIRLTPTFVSNGILYIGEQTVINLSDNSIRNEGVNSDGSLNVEEVENSVNKETSTITNYNDVFTSYLQSLISGLGSLPSLFQAVFSFIPSIYINSIGIILSIILILRILGR